MTTVDSQRQFQSLHSRRSRLLLGLSVVAAVLLYFAAVHPATGFIGWLVLLAISWLVPSLLNLLITALVLSFLPISLGQRAHVMLLATLGISLVLAIAPEARFVFHRLTHPPVQLVEIKRQIAPDRPLPLVIKDLPFIVDNPLRTAITVGGNEGCMCTYWTFKNGTPQHILGALKILGAAEGGYGETPRPDNRYHILVRMETSDKGSAFVVEVHDGAEVTAKLAVAPLQYYPYNYYPDPHKQKEGLLNDHFTENVIHGLTHGTFWSPLIGAWLGYLPGTFALRQFFSNSLLLPTK